jgi:hypothetical protein
LGNRLVITLKHGGYEKILESTFIKDISIVIKNRFGVEIDTEFVGQLEDVEMELPPPEAPAPIVRQSKPKEEKRLHLKNVRINPKTA